MDKEEEEKVQILNKVCKERNINFKKFDSPVYGYYGDKYIYNEKKEFECVKEIDKDLIEKDNTNNKFQKYLDYINKENNNG